MRLTSFLHRTTASLLRASLAACVVSSAPQSWAWDQHHLVTRASVLDLPDIRSYAVRYTSLDSLLKDIGFQSIREFNESIQTRKEYSFPAKLGETEGAAVPVLEVLAGYSDEPDWGMDKEIFGQYPEIWKEEYSRMGGKEGTPSQAFRHMYWPEFAWRMPVRTFKVPLGRLFSPMGLAPARAAIFMDLSRKVRRAGHPYWSVRFVANALHYLEDAANPFHASQTPTKRFAFMPIFDRDKGQGVKNYLLQVQNIIAYYHYAFEKYISHHMQAYSATQNSPEGEEFVRALAGKASVRDAPENPRTTLAELVVEMAQLSVRQSARAGRVSIDFFPPIQARFDAFDPEKYVDRDPWWKQPLRSGRGDSVAKQEYFRIVEEMFSRLGIAVRTVVEAEVLQPLSGR